MTTATLLLATLLASADLRFEATTASNAKTVAGSLDVLAANWSASVGGTAIAAGDLVELRQLGVELPALPGGPQLLLANGDRWPGRVIEIANDKVRFAPAFGANAELTVPLTAVVAMWLGDPPYRDDPVPTDFDLVTAKRGEDIIRLANHDTLIGTITSLDRNTLQIENKGVVTKVPRERVVALALSSELTKLAKPKVPYARIVLTSGARVTLLNAEFHDGRLTGTSAAGPAMRVLLGDVASLNIHNGPAVYLSELTPTKYEHTPYMSVSYPYTADRSVAGGPLRLSGDTFDRGIGLHSKSRLVYAVPAGATRFECYLGLDAVSGKLGQALCSVQVDGKDLLSPAVMTATNTRHLILPLRADAKELVLNVDFGPGGNVQDHVNWADARFIKRP
ncbi:MAG: NPCBM/NEW2 domain-containing protein [Gemmataceae bacterium]